MVEPLRAVGVTAGAWVVAVAVTVALPSPSSVLFSPAGQVAFATLALLAGVVALVRRGRFETDRVTPLPGLPQGDCDDRPCSHRPGPQPDDDVRAHPPWTTCRSSWFQV